MGRALRTGTRLLGLTVVVVAGAALALHGREWLEVIPAFHVTTVTVSGIERLSEAEVLASAAVEPGQSIFGDLAPVEQRLREAPLVADVRVQRRFPDALEVQIRERVPIAVVPMPHLVAVDMEGVLLPSIDPGEERLDLPVILPQVIGRRSEPLTPLERRLLASELVRLQELEPRLTLVISEIELDTRGDIRVSLILPSTRILFTPPVTATRLREGVLVLADVLERRAGGSPTEVDLRFSEQVVIRDAVEGRS
jgi:cell division septal protein FtsQ